MQSSSRIKRGRKRSKNQKSSQHRRRRELIRHIDRGSFPLTNSLDDLAWRVRCARMAGRKIWWFVAEAGL